LKKLLELKEQNSKEEFTMKDMILRKNFAGTVEKLLTKIRA